MMRQKSWNQFKKNNGCLDTGRSDHFYRVCGDAFGYSFCRYNGTDRSGIV